MQGRTVIERPNYTPEALDAALGMIRSNMTARLEKHGWGQYASRHEALGIITEEYDELLRAIRKDRNPQKFYDEVLDLAVAAALALAVIT